MKLTRIFSAFLSVWGDLLSFPVPGATEEIAWLWFALGISGQADTIRALTRKLQLGPSGSNWESEHTEHARTNVAGGLGQVL